MLGGMHPPIPPRIGTTVLNAQNKNGGRYGITLSYPSFNFKIRAQKVIMDGTAFWLFINNSYQVDKKITKPKFLRMAKIKD